MKTLSGPDRAFLPVTSELTAENLPVVGEVPGELSGLYVRNGPNPRDGAAAHPFMGEGMLHGVWLEDGQARRYANRWVGPNTNVVRHADKMLALVEVAPPTAIGDDLKPIGEFTYGGMLRTPMTAHPKLCPTTGELHFFGSQWDPLRSPLTYHRVSASGALVESREIAVPAHTMMHDFALTERYVVFMDLPVVFDIDRAKAGTMPFRWSDTHGARFGVLPRAGGGVRWFDVAPCYVFHVLNAYDEGSKITVEGMRYPDLWRNDPTDFPAAALHRWVIDVESGVIVESALDDLATEFPRINELRATKKHRFGYAVHFDRIRGGAVVKYDLATGQRSERFLGAGMTFGEAVFVPRQTSAAEDDGWLMSYLYDAADDTSALVILEAASLELQARIQLPQRVPFGFHGGWFNA